MIKINHDLIKVGLFSLGCIMYSGFIIYLICLDKNNISYLKNISHLNMKLGIFFMTISLILIRINSIYFRKKTGYKYGDPTINFYVNLADYLVHISNSFTIGSVFWILIFLGLVNK